MKLSVEKREVVGRKVNSMRKTGVLPASIFGPGIEPVNIQVNEKEFLAAFKKAGYNHFIDLAVGSEKPFKVIVKDVQAHPVNDKIHSIGFYKIDENRKIYVDIPIEFVGKSVVETNKLGFLVHQFESIKVHCLPKDVPEKLTVDISSIETPGDAITISNLDIPQDVELDSSLEGSNAVVYAVSVQKQEAAAEAAEASTEAPAATPEAGAEGEAKAESTEEKA